MKGKSYIRSAWQHGRKGPHPLRAKVTCELTPRAHQIIGRLCREIQQELVPDRKRVAVGAAISVALEYTYDQLQKGALTYHELCGLEPPPANDRDGPRPP